MTEHVSWFYQFLMTTNLWLSCHAEFHLIRNSLLRASATSMTCANLLLNSNTVFLSKQKSLSKDVLVFLLQSRLHSTVFKETRYDHPVLTLMKCIHTQMPDRMRDQGSSNIGFTSCRNSNSNSLFECFRLKCCLNN